MGISLSQLRAFVAVSRYGSFTLAADALHRTQPAVTVQIQQLEKELGLQLFDRSTRTLRMTSTGLELAPVLSTLLGQLDQVVQGSQDLREKRSGIIRIGCLPSVAAAFLPTRIEAFRRKHPGIGFVLRDDLGDRLLPMVRTGEVEFVISDVLPNAGDLENTFLMEEQMHAFFAKGHPLSKIKDASIEELSRHDLILMAQGSNARRIVDTAFAAAGRQAFALCEASYMSTAIGMAEAGLGVALLPALGVHLERHPHLRSLRLPGKMFSRQIALIRLRGKTLSPAARAFIGDLAPADTRNKPGPRKAAPK